MFEIFSRKALISPISVGSKPCFFPELREREEIEITTVPPMREPMVIAAATKISPIDQQRHFLRELLFLWPGRLSFVTINFSPLKFS